jgi:hypothetical protein
MPILEGSGICGLRLMFPNTGYTRAIKHQTKL